MRIGVDVGGTNTDAVLLSGGRVVGAVKRATSEDVSAGVREAIAAVLAETGTPAGAIGAVMIGTTHFTNALVEARALAPVFAIRIGLPATRDIPPFTGWPDRVAAQVDGGHAMIAGGFQFDGRTLCPLDEAALLAAAGRIAASDVREVAITGVFSQINAEQEARARDLILSVVPDASVTLSSDVGRAGLIERENAACINGSLRPLAARVTAAFARSLAELAIDAPFFVSQNDGTLMTADQMRRFPVLTFAAGPTNSLRGACHLSGLKDALVVDIGGTTSDIGVLAGGFPRQSSVHVDVGGIRTNFRMPDILAIGLGGGSRVRQDGRTVTVGPDSVGYRLRDDAMAFGGGSLTATDVALAGGLVAIDGATTPSLDADLVADALAEMRRTLESGIDRMKTSEAAVPLILVGGGAILVDGTPDGISQVVRPPHFDVANAIGAAIGQVGGQIDRIFPCVDGDRQAALDEAVAMARAAAVAAGADAASTQVIELEDLPLQYLPGSARRIICRVVGDLAGTEGTRRD